MQTLKDGGSWIKMQPSRISDSRLRKSHMDLPAKARTLGQGAVRDPAEQVQTHQQGEH